MIILYAINDHTAADTHLKMRRLLLSHSRALVHTPPSAVVVEPLIALTLILTLGMKISILVPCHGYKVLSISIVTVFAN